MENNKVAQNEKWIKLHGFSYDKNMAKGYYNQFFLHFFVDFYSHYDSIVNWLQGAFYTTLDPDDKPLNCRDYQMIPNVSNYFKLFSFFIHAWWRFLNLIYQNGLNTRYHNFYIIIVER